MHGSVSGWGFASGLAMGWPKNKNGRCEIRVLDPTLSESSFPLPGIEYRLEGATGYQIFLPITPAGDWFRPVGSSLLVRRTNLLSPSVTLLPVFKVTLTTATRTDCVRVFRVRQQYFNDKDFPQDIYPPS